MILNVIWMDKNMHNNSGSVSEIKNMYSGLKVTTFTEIDDGEEFLDYKMIS